MRALVSLLFVVAACSSENAPPSPDAAPPDAHQNVCADPSPPVCDGEAQDEDHCPTLEELCTPDACGSYECCWCGDNGTWEFVSLDCFEGC
jgi:hypothetical protein